MSAGVFILSTLGRYDSEGPLVEHSFIYDLFDGQTFCKVGVL